MGGKSSTQCERFLRCLPIDNDEKSDYSALENFHHQIKANLPYNATEIVRFVKIYEIWGFLK